MARKQLVCDKPTELYHCVKLFEVEESSAVAGGETPLHAWNPSLQSQKTPQICIEQCCWKETGNYSILVLVCNNGYLVMRLELFLCTPVIKQLKWFEGRDQHILGVTLDPLGEWLACACLDGGIYLVPVLPLMNPDCFPSHAYGPLDDITVVTPSRKVAPPTSIVWWEGLDGQQICITGSELGEITFFNLHTKEEVASIGMKGYIDQLMLTQRQDSTTHLLINLRGGEWWWMLLEERFHEAADASYTDVQASGFEVVYDDAVHRSFITQSNEGGGGSLATGFEPRLFHNFSEVTKLSLQEWKEQYLLGALNLQSHTFEMFSYDFEFQAGPVRSFTLPSSTTHTLTTERLLFCISHSEDETDNCMYLSVLSNELTQRSVNQLLPSAVLQQFSIPSSSNIVGVFSTTLESREVASESHDLIAPTNLGGCVIITSSTVYHCQQILSPEKVFLTALESLTNYHLTDELAITFRLDICGLYKAGAEQKLCSGAYVQALRLFKLSRCPASEVIGSFVKLERIPELLKFLEEAVYDETGNTPSTPPKILQDVLLKCFIHQCLECTSTNEASTLNGNFNQFINDKFLYNHSVAMELLIQNGMKGHLLEIAKAHHNIGEALEQLVSRGSSELDSTIQTLLTAKQFAEPLSTVADGLLLLQMTPTNFAKCVLVKPAIIPTHLSHLVSVLPHLDISVLTRLACLFDPSAPTIQPLLSKAHNSSIKRSNSTSSVLSVSTEGSIPVTSQPASLSDRHHPGPSLKDYLEAFLQILILLNHKQLKRPLTSTGLFSLSPLVDRIGLDPSERLIRPLQAFSDGSQMMQSSLLSCGLNHAALVSGRDLHTWGSTKCGKLGHGDIEMQPQSAPLRVETLAMLNVTVLSVSCGAEHTVAVCQEGVFSWGSSAHGQLGLGDTLKRAHPVQVSSLANVALMSLVCGQYHCIALDEDHRVWTWGWGVHGQLGLNSADDVHIPTHVRELDSYEVCLVTAGFNHSAVIDSKGKLYTFGNGMYGQLGHGDQEKQLSPKLVESLADEVIYLVVCGNSHTLAVSSNQTVYHWGKNFHKPQPGSGAQGLKQYTRSRREGARSPAISNALVPMPIQDLKLDDIIVQASCGNYHSLLLTLSGSVYSWGSNVHGQIGHTHTPELSHPKRVSKLENHHILAVSCGDEFSIALDNEGYSWVWGRDDTGQLGMEYKTNSVREGKKICIFSPNPNPQIPHIAPIRPKEMSPEGQDPSPPGLDIDWNLPDFGSIGPLPGYGRQALTAALIQLHSYYRTSAVLWSCLNWSDWESMAVIFTVEEQWAHVLICRLRGLQSRGDVSESKAMSVVDECIMKLISGIDNYHSQQFVLSSLQMIQLLSQFWKEQSLSVEPLETLLSKYLSMLACPISILMRSDVATEHFSFKFSLSVAMEMSSQIKMGVSVVDDLTALDQSDHTADQEDWRKIVTELTPGDKRLWGEILRNLSTNLSKHNNILVSELSLAGIRQHQAAQGKPLSMVAFSCGHTFSETLFHSKVLMDFAERLQDFPVPIPLTNSFLQQYYRQPGCYSCACPYCVFQHLRKGQLERCPKVPIRPWSL